MVLSSVKGCLYSGTESDAAQSIACLDMFMALF